jgi:glycerophosphoryl diester phosphodiesterase
MSLKNAMFRSYVNRYKNAWHNLRKEIRPIISFEIWFSLIFAIALAPFSAWLVNSLFVSIDQIAISNEDIISFFISFRGIGFILLSGAFFLGLAFLEWIGLMTISLAAADGRVVSVSRVLGGEMVHFWSVIRLGVLQAVIYLSVSLPFIAAGALTYFAFLAEHDINYFLAERPWQLWVALIISALIGGACLLLGAWLYIRWLFAIPALIFENAPPIEALRKSWQRTRHRFIELAMPQVVWWVFIVSASFVSALVLKALFTFLLVYAELNLYVILPLVVVALGIIFLNGLFWLTLGKAVYMFLIVDFYREIVKRKIRLPEKWWLLKKMSPSVLKYIGWAAVGLALVATIFVGVAYFERFNLDRHHVAVTAHRGSSLQAPENTISALKQAIADGADYAEIDVQATADGVVILMHDADLMRVASIDRKIAEMQYAELSTIDIGSWFSKDFSKERIATLEEAIRFCNGRIKLNIELKYNRPDLDLVGKVGTLIRSNSCAENCVITSLDYGELRMFKTLFPEVKVGLTVFQALGYYTHSKVDFLSIDAAQATSRRVKETQLNGKQIHVWTVNDLHTALAMIEVGADNIITDKPAAVQKWLQAWNNLTGTQKIALWLRNLFLKTTLENITLWLRNLISHDEHVLGINPLL